MLSSRVHLLATPWAAARQASMPLPVSRSLPKFMFIAGVISLLSRGLSGVISLLSRGLSGVISLLSRGLSGVFSLLSRGLSGVFAFTVGRREFFGALPSLRPALTTVHDHWPDHGLDYTDLYWQSNVSAFQYTV